MRGDWRSTCWRRRAARGGPLRGGNSVGPKVNITLPLVSFEPVVGDQPDHRRWGGSRSGRGPALRRLSARSVTRNRLMVGLDRYRPAVEKVTIRGQEVEVVGVSAAGIAPAAGALPGPRRMFAGRDVGRRPLAMGGDLVAAIIAAGTGDPGDRRRGGGGRLGIDEQAISSPPSAGDAPKGVGPFVEKLAALGAGLDAAGGSGTGRDTTSRKRSRADRLGTRRTPSGAARRARWRLPRAGRRRAGAARRPTRSRSSMRRRHMTPRELRKAIGDLAE